MTELLNTIDGMLEKASIKVEEMLRIQRRRDNDMKFDMKFDKNFKNIRKDRGIGKVQSGLYENRKYGYII